MTNDENTDSSLSAESELGKGLWKEIKDKNQSRLGNWTKMIQEGDQETRDGDIGRLGRILRGTNEGDQTATMGAADNGASEPEPV